MTIMLMGDAGSVHIHRQVAGLQNSGHIVHVLSFRNGAGGDVKVNVLPTYGLWKLGYFLNIARIRRMIEVIRPDIIHSHHITSYGAIGALARARPLVISAWGTDLLINPKRSLLKRITTVMALKRADIIIAEAEHVRVRAIELGADPRKCRVLSLGSRLSIFKYIPDRKGEARPYHLVSTRNLSAVYDVGTFVKALAILNRRFTGFSVTIAGDGPLRAELEGLCDAMFLRGKVTFIGRVSEQAIANLLASADIFVTTSLSDGENISLNEAMACGCFPVASDIPANAVIEDGRNGILFAPGDPRSLAEALKRAIDIKAAWPEIIARNRDWVERNCDITICQKKLEGIYMEAIASRHVQRDI